MKRTFLISIILCLIFSLFGCVKAPEKTELQSENADILTVSTPDFLEDYVYNSTDLFTATVLDSKKLPKNLFKNYVESSTADTILYTVQVKSVLRGFSVAENTKIYVARFVKEADEKDEKYYKPFEKGKDYLILGFVKPLDGKPVILDNGRFSVEIKDDGKLIPLSEKSQLLFKDTETYDDFLQNEKVKDVIDNYDIYLTYDFHTLLETEPFSKTDEETDIYGIVKSEKEEIRQLIREAIPVDSKKKIEIPEK